MSVDQRVQSLLTPLLSGVSALKMKLSGCRGLLTSCDLGITHLLSASDRIFLRRNTTTSVFSSWCRGAGESAWQNATGACLDAYLI